MIKIWINRQKYESEVSSPSPVGRDDGKKHTSNTHTLFHFHHRSKHNLFELNNHRYTMSSPGPGNAAATGKKAVHVKVRCHWSIPFTWHPVIYYGTTVPEYGNLVVYGICGYSTHGLVHSSVVPVCVSLEESFCGTISFFQGRVTWPGTVIDKHHEENERSKKGFSKGETEAPKRPRISPELTLATGAS